jgi:hypothetical protein
MRHTVLFPDGVGDLIIGLLALVLAIMILSVLMVPAAV